MAVVASAAVAVGATTAGINLVTTDGTVPAAAEAAITRIGPLPAGAAISRNPAVPAGQQLKAIAAHQKADRLRKAALRKARADRLARERRATRSRMTGDPRAIARAMAEQKYGWGAGQFACLNSLWIQESQWNTQASNSSSGAYGIPQALPGSKMAAFGSDWRTNPATQIAWGLNYINGRYGSPCSAWNTAQSQGWY
jgi:hypothetical protein